MKLAKAFEAFERSSRRADASRSSSPHPSQNVSAQSPSAADNSGSRAFRPKPMHNLSSGDAAAINNAISREKEQRESESPTIASGDPATTPRPSKARTIMDRSTSPLNISDTTNPVRPGPYVLLVDDNAVNLQLLVAFMNKLSLPFARATNGLEAFEAYKEQSLAGRPFDHILMDINMPVMDGLTSTKEIRNFERQNGVKRAMIAALTGMAGQSIQVEASQIGVDHYFSKPVRFKELKRVILDDWVNQTTS